MHIDAITCDMYVMFFSNLGPRLITGSDHNAEDPWWGSRFNNTKGKEFYKSTVNRTFRILSTGEPTYWPSDTRRYPDLPDFIVYSASDHTSAEIRVLVRYRRIRKI